MTVADTIERHADIVAETDTLEREDWLDLRRMGLGGSDAAAVLGLNPWRTPYTVWADKTEQIDHDDNPNMRMRCGQLLEPVVGTLFAEETGIEVQRFPWMLRSRQWPWMVVNLDFVCDSPQAALEAKTTDARNAWQWQDAEGGATVPDSYMIQGQHELAVTGLDRVFFGALIGGNDFRVVEVHRDPYLIENLVEAERKFWELVEDVKPPAPDGSDATSKAIREMYPTSDPGLRVVLPERAQEVLTNLARAKVAYAEAETEKKAYENQIKAMLGNAELGVLNGQVAVTWKSSKVKAHWREESVRRPLILK